MTHLTSKKSSINWDALLAALLLIIVVGPYFVWPITENNYLMLLVRVLFVFLCFKHSSIKQNNKSLAFFFCFTVFFKIAVALSHGNININGVISSIILFFYVFIFFTEISFTRKVFEYFTYTFSLLLLISLVVWTLALSGTISPIGSITREANMRTYSVFPMLVVEFGNDFYRFSGPFDEPGVVGTIGGCLLCIRQFSIKDWKNWVVLIAGLLSFSLFFYVLVGVYIIAYTVLVKKKVLLTLLLVSCFGLFYLGTRDNDVMYERMWKRMEWNSDDGKYQGDNRVNEDVDRYYDNIKGTSAFFFGIDDIESFWNDVGESASYKVAIVTHGMVFIILYLSFFLLLAWKNKVSVNEFLLFCFVLIGNTYQRPAIYSLIMLFLYSVMARKSLIVDNVQYVQQLKK